MTGHESSADRRGLAPDSAVTRTAVINRAQVDALAALLEVESPQEHLPELWHWTHLLDARRSRELGPDGHPTNGIPAPPGPNRRRMFAGGRVKHLGLLRIGEEAMRRTDIAQSVTKQGRSGPLEFVTVRHVLSQAGSVVIEEENDIVYLPQQPAEAGVGNEKTPAGERGVVDGSVDGGTPVLTLSVDETFLFRFSALTYNAHRIHYDHRWAAHEGYPDLVVHGPLQALMMGEAMRRGDASGGGVPLEGALVGRTFTFRLERPMMGPQRFGVFADGDGALCVRDSAGKVTARAAA